MGSPEVSVIISNFNRDDLLRRAVESVLSQRGICFELLVVDDASDQPPTELYQELLEAGHRVLAGSQRRGPGPSRNWGAEQARGRYLALLDSDDYWLPDKLARHYEHLRHSGHRVGQVAEIWMRDGVRVAPLPAHRNEGGDIFERSLRAVCVSPSAVMLDRELFFEVGGFDPELFVCEDYDLWLRVAARETFDLLAEPLAVKVGGHADQLSKALPAMDRFRLRSLTKGLMGGAFGQRWPSALQELLRKAAILGKGAAKRGNAAAQEACWQLCRLAEDGQWEQAHLVTGQLLGMWPSDP